MTQGSIATEPRFDEDDETAQKNEKRRWRGALFLSGVVHTAILVLLFLLWQPASDDSVPLPSIPVTIVHEKEGQSGATGGGTGTTPASSASSASASTATSSAAPSAAVSEPSLPALRQTQPFSAIPNLAQVTTPAPAPPPRVVQPIPPRKPVPPRPTPPAPTETTQAPPTPKPPTEQQAAQAPAQTAANAASSAATADTNQQGVGGRGRGDQGAGRAAVGNGSAEGTGDDYLEQVRRWVTRFKKYPEEAVKQKQEGAVSLGFKFSRDGTILDAWIDKSSGFPLLDQAALDMIHAASPIPKVPDRYPGDTLTLVMAENFKIGFFDRLFH